MKIHLRIDQVVLDGVQLGPHQEPALRAALQAALAERFRSEQSFGSSATTRIQAQAPEFAAQAELLGRQIAEAIHRSVPRHAE